MNPKKLRVARTDLPTPALWPQELFIGRREELQVLRTSLAFAQSGHPQYCMIEGVPGIGKTRLSRELASYAEKDGVTVLWGRCYEDSGVPPYWPWIEIIRGYIEGLSPEDAERLCGAGAADIARIVPEVNDKIPGLRKPEISQSSEFQFRLFDAIRGFLKRAAVKAPLLLIFDNLHCCDRSSLRLLQQLFEDTGQSALQIVGNYRPVDMQHPVVETLGELSRCPNSVRINAGPLTEDEVRQFASSFLGDKPKKAQIDTIYRLTEGNPLYVLEVLRLIKQEHTLDNKDLWLADLPKAIRVVISRRLNGLSETCNRMLVTASLIAKDIRPAEIRAVESEMTERQLYKAIDEAVVAALIEESLDTPSSYSFSHALMQEAIASGLTPERRRELHYKIGVGLEKLYADKSPAAASGIARHFSEVGRPAADRKAIRYLVEAGCAATDIFATDEAIDHFLRAEEINRTVNDDEWSAEICAGMSKALFLSDRDEEALPYLGRAFELYIQLGFAAKAVEAAEMPYKKTIGWHWSPVDKQIFEMRSRALELVETGSIERGRLLCQCGQFWDFLDGYDRAREAFEEALAIARKEKDVELQSRIIANWSQTDISNLRLLESTEKQIEALNLARAAGDLQSEQFMLHQAGFGALAMGDPDQSRRYITEIVQLEERIRLRWESGNYHLQQTLAALTGDWKSAMELGRNHLKRNPSELFSRHVAAIVAYETGDIESCNEHLTMIQNDSTTAGRFLNDGYRVIAALTLAKLSEVSNTDQRLQIAQSLAKEVLAASIHQPKTELLAVMALLLTGITQNDKDRLAIDFDDHLANSGSWITPWGLVSIDRILGLRAGALGNTEEAKRHLGNAREFCRDAEYLPELAWVFFDLGRVLARSDVPADRAEGQRCLDQSITIAGKLGMRTLRKKAEIERSSNKERTAVLTKREIEVLNLISEGKSNQEIAFELSISEHTVGNHVANILRKTESANRAEAALYGARHGLIANSD